MPAKSTNAMPGPSQRLIGPPGGWPKSGKKTPGASQFHRSYPESKAGTASAGFDPSKTALGKVFEKGNATADSLPVTKKMSDRTRGKSRN
jgi:hypothetical protein